MAQRHRTPALEVDFCSYGWQVLLFGGPAVEGSLEFVVIQRCEMSSLPVMILAPNPRFFGVVQQKHVSS